MGPLSFGRRSAVVALSVAWMAAADVKLSNGRGLPLLGLGCASGVRRSHVESALQLGYRLLDTAQADQWGYHEDEVGEAIQGLPREEIFLQSKIHPQDLGYASTKRAFQVSLDRLKTSYLDAMLLHKPWCWPGACSREPEGTWQDSWRALEELQRQRCAGHRHLRRGRRASVGAAAAEAEASHCAELDGSLSSRQRASQKVQRGGDPVPGL